MRAKSSVTPPRIALVWPSSAVPAPKAITGQPCAAQMFTIRATSSVVSG